MNEDAQLVEACLGGRAEAFETIVSRYQGLVCSLTFSGTGRLDSSEELAQETFVRAWKNLDQLKEPAKLRPWLCSIARNLIHNHTRSQKNAPSNRADLDEELATNHDDGPEATMIRQEEEQMICTALARIPDEYRQPLILFYRQDLSARQVADLLDLDEGTVRTRLHRGRKMLRRHVEAAIARALRQSAPGAAFTRSVMVGIGAGLAASAAGGTATAGIVAAAETGAAVAATGGLLTAATMKITAATAAVILAAGAVIYSMQPDHNPQPPAEPMVPVAASPQPQENETERPVLARAQNEPHAVQTVTADPGAVEQAPAVTIQPAQPAAAVRHPDWPGLNEPVRYVYFESHLSSGDETQNEKLWARLPDAFRAENESDRHIIDDGRQRLTLYPETKQAQLEPSWFVDGKMIWMHRQSLEDRLEGYHLMFREPNAPPGVTLTLLAETEENGQVLLYRVESDDTAGINLTARVDARTRLPERMQAEITGEPKEGQTLFAGEILFDFSPIPDDIFSTAIPAGYDALPEKRVNTFSGLVIDWTGAPVSGAEVFLHNTFGSGGPWKAISDDKGHFSIAMQPFDTGFAGSVVLWAVMPNEPDLIAWTMLINPREHEYFLSNPLAGTIPGDPGTVYSSEGYFYEKIENGFRTQGVWCVGASEIVLVLEPGISVEGNVSDIYGNAITDARMSFEIDWLADIYGNASNWPFPRGMIQTRSGADGCYAIANFPRLWKQCAFSIRVQPPATAGLVSDEKRIRIADPNEPVEADFVLLPKGPTVRGVLKDNYGTSLSEREVSVRVDGKTFAGYLTRTDEKGRFEIEHCPADAGLEIRATLSHNMTSMLDKAHASYVYYPDVTVPAGYDPQKDEYEVELVAVLPEITIEAVVTDSTGRPLPYFPVEIRADESISTQWKHDRQFHKRTDANGRITFTNVPEMKGLRLVCSYILNPITDRSETEEMKRYLKDLEQAYKTYHWNETPVPLEPGVKDYDMHVIILTEDEHRRQKSLPVE